MRSFQPRVVQPVPALASTIDDAGNNRKEGGSSQKAHVIHTGESRVRCSDRHGHQPASEATNNGGRDRKENYYKHMGCYYHVINLVVSEQCSRST